MSHTPRTDDVAVTNIAGCESLILTECHSVPSKPGDQPLDSQAMHQSRLSTNGKKVRVLDIPIEEMDVKKLHIVLEPHTSSDGQTVRQSWLYTKTM